jgi:UDP-glucose 4-epimerase
MPYPLPLGGLTARRSLLSVENLAAAIDTVLVAPAPLRRPFIVADPEALTVPEMIAAMRRGLGRSPGLVPVPAALLKLGLAIAGRPDWYERLAQPLVADPSALVELGWQPQVSSRRGLETLMSAAA